MAIPRDLVSNLKLRRALLLAAAEDSRIQRGLLAICEQDFFFWVDLFVWQFNPNISGDEVGPFIAWDYQVEDVPILLAAINDYQSRKDVVIEKSREMGASWMCLLVFLWFMLFKKNKKFLIISRNLEAVDAPDEPDSLFWKLRFVLSHLPMWMKRGVVDKKLRLTNRLTKSFITGTATTKAAGVGGRASAIFVDEFSQIESAQEVLHDTADTSRCRIFNFTHRSLGTPAAELAARPDVTKIVWHWSRHPHKNAGLYSYDGETNRLVIYDKDYKFPEDYNFVMDGTPGGPYPGLRSPWYDNECARRGSRAYIAMNLDIDPRGSSHLFFDHALIIQLKRAYGRPPLWVGDISYDRETGRPGELVQNDDGSLKLWVHPNPSGRPPVMKAVIGADIGAGLGATPTCFSIANIETGEKIGEWANNRIDNIQAAYIYAACGWMFTSADGEPAFLIWEHAGVGLKFGQTVMNLGYRNVYYRKSEFTVTAKASLVYGWVPGSDSKRVLFEGYRQNLASRVFVNPSILALDECLGYKYTPKGDVEHAVVLATDNPLESGQMHGDRAVADALASKIISDKGGGFHTGAILKETSMPVNSLGWRRQQRLAKMRHREQWS